MWKNWVCCKVEGLSRFDYLGFKSDKVLKRGNLISLEKYLVGVYSLEVMVFLRLILSFFGVYDFKY